MTRGVETPGSTAPANTLSLRVGLQKVLEPVAHGFLKSRVKAAYESFCAGLAAKAVLEANRIINGTWVGQ